MKKQKIKGILLSSMRKNNSINGNPCYNVIIQCEDGNIICGKTASDASCGYSVSNCENDKKYHIFTFHYTTKGNRIVDYID